MKEISKALLDVKAVSLSPEKPFTWASGIKSPIYCDNRLTLSYPKERKLIEEELVNLVKRAFPDCEMLMGTATAGIPHAAIMAYQMDLPMGFVRSIAKDHGKENRIEGKITKGMKVVVVEDLISTGGSSVNVVEALKEAGFDVLGIVAIFTYELQKAKENIVDKGIRLETLTNYSELIDVAVDMNYIEEKSLQKLVAWRVNPQDEAWMKK